MLSLLTPTQWVTLILFTLTSLWGLVYSTQSKQLSIIGTGGTIIAPLLATYLFVVLQIDFYFANNISVEAIGLIVYLTGVMLGYWALKHLQHNLDDFWKAQYSSKERQLVQSGPYQYVRHPIYTSMFLKYIGLLLVFFHSISVVLVLLFFIGLVITLLQEEKFLEERFPEYSSYKDKVGMLIPRFSKD